VICRKTWLPPERRDSCAANEWSYDGGSLLFASFARNAIDAKKSHGLSDKTLADLDWKLDYLLAELGRLELRQIDVARTDKLRDDLTRRSRAIAEAAARGNPLTETVKTCDGRRYLRRTRSLSNTSINGILSLLSQILQRAVDYGYIDRNPLKAGQRRDRYLPAVKPRRTFLEIDELHALLDAAGELEGAARRDRRIARRAALATLALCGLRISELCELLCAHVELDRARLKVIDAKTPKGVREVEIPEWLLGELRAHGDQRVRDLLPMGPEDHFFGTVTGKRRDTNRFRDRVLAKSVALASERRASHGLARLPRITPHSLRRTWAMLAAQAGRDSHWISDQIGHTSAAFTLQVYQQTRHRRLTADERQAIWALMRFADEPKRSPFIR
jgi:integrase